MPLWPTAMPAGSRFERIKTAAHQEVDPVNATVREFACGAPEQVARELDRARRPGRA